MVWCTRVWCGAPGYGALGYGALGYDYWYGISLIIAYVLHITMWAVCSVEQGNEALQEHNRNFLEQCTAHESFYYAPVMPHLCPIMFTCMFPCSTEHTAHIVICST